MPTRGKPRRLPTPSVGRDVEQVGLPCTTDGVKNGTALGEKAWQCLTKLNKLLSDLAIPLLGISSKEMKTCPQKDLYQNVHCSLFKVVKQQTQLKNKGIHGSVFTNDA